MTAASRSGGIKDFAGLSGCPGMINQPEQNGASDNYSPELA
jgi:hypothetical protein